LSAFRSQPIVTIDIDRADADVTAKSAHERFRVLHWRVAIYKQPTLTEVERQIGAFGIAVLSNFAQAR
jgi:hypothetical protein